MLTRVPFALLPSVPPRLRPENFLGFFACMALVCALVSPANADTLKCGAICGETWTASGSPYRVTCDLSVAAECSLTIESGVDVKIEAQTTPLRIDVEGTLDVNGSEAARVTFRSNATTPAAGDWAGLRLRSGATASLRNADIEHAERGLDLSESVSVVLDGIHAQENRDGLAFFGNVEITGSNCWFTDNSRYGIYGEGKPSETDASIDVHQSEIHSNSGAHDIHLGGGFSTPEQTIFLFRENWWGTTVGMDITARIYDRLDLSSNARVDWCALLDSPGGVPTDMACVDLYICDETATWDRTDAPYVVTTDLVVCYTGTLKIEEGVEIRVIGSTAKIPISVYGVLEINGTPESRVTIRSDEAVPEVSHWEGVRVAGSGRASIRYADISHAEMGIKATGSAVVDLIGTRSRFNYEGLYVRGNGPPTVTASDCAFTSNDHFGIYLYGTPDPDVTVTHSEIHSNQASYDLMTFGYADPWHEIVLARENWWGTIDPVTIGSRIIDHRYADSRPTVDWCAFLDGPGGVPARDVHCPNLTTCDETQTLSLTDKPYQITSDLWVCPTGTLRLEPGVELRSVKTSQRQDFLVEGTFEVSGTDAAPVVLSSDETPPSTGDWIGPFLSAGSHSTIEHAEISRADWGIRAGDDADVVLRHVTMTNNQDGLYVYGSGPPVVTATDCAFTGNDRYGIYLHGNADPIVSISRSSIHSNRAAYDLLTFDYLDAEHTVVPFTENWWGTTDPLSISSRIIDHRYADTRPHVDWCSYLDGPDGSPARDVHCPDLVTCGETQIWDLVDKPYLLVTDLWVCPGATLHIDAGVQVHSVKTSPRQDFLVEGVLEIEGSSTRPVLLSSDGSPQAAGDWIGPVLSTGSSSTIKHAEVSFADHGFGVEEDADVTLLSVKATHNQDGLYVSGSGPPVVRAAGCTLTGNERYGLHVLGSPDPEVSITRSSIHSNLGNYDVMTYNFADPENSVVWAPDNWWGTSDEEMIGERILDQEDDNTRPRVAYRVFGEACDPALAADRDNDGHPDFADTCPDQYDSTQLDSDQDGMGDACDPQPFVAPTDPCDGFEDQLDGYLDFDADGWGDPCDHQPTRYDSHLGAPERCDARDNDGDAVFAAGELTDRDADLGVACGDCDDEAPDVHACSCELCTNLRDDDCDGQSDEGDSDCEAFPTCITLVAATDPQLMIEKGACGGAAVAGLYDVIRGTVASLHFAGSSVDLGPVKCVASELAWDRVTENSAKPNPRCDDLASLFFLARNTGSAEFGSASSGESRDVMDPTPPCP